jgi:thiol-disulfide isomerase/thioredoxin
MRLTFPSSFSARRIAAVVAVFALAAFAASCELDGASKKRAEASRNAANSGSRMPRTNLPMPPVSASHGESLPVASGGSPRGGWTQPDGRRVSLEDLRGQVVVLDFWATYCPPCREEVPHLLALQKRYGAQGLNVVGLNVGGDEDKPKVADFVKEFKISYQLGYPDDALASIVFAERDDIPQTYVFDRNGRLVERFFGYGPRVAEGLERAVQVALASKSNEGD